MTESLRQYFSDTKGPSSLAFECFLYFFCVNRALFLNLDLSVQRQMIQFNASNCAAECPKCIFVSSAKHVDTWISLGESVENFFKYFI